MCNKTRIVHKLILNAQHAKKTKETSSRTKKSTWLTSEAEEATAIKASVAAKKDFMWTLFNMKFGQKGVEKCRCV